MDAPLNPEFSVLAAGSANTIAVFGGTRNAGRFTGNGEVCRGGRKARIGTDARN
jgi:hypothetical protein